MTAVTASTPPADVVASTKRHRRHRERGVLFLAAIAAVALLWLSLDAPGLKLVLPGVARDKAETPVVADLVLQPGRIDTPRPAATASAAPSGSVRRTSGRTTAIVAAAPATAAVPAATPTTQPPQVRVASVSSTPLSSPQVPAPPAVPAPVELPPAASPVISAVVSTVTAAVPATSDVTNATQQLTSTLPDVPTLHP